MDEEPIDDLTELLRRGFLGTEHDYDRAHAELIKRGCTDEEAHYAIMSSCW